jgi:hypothetical protein
MERVRVVTLEARPSPGNEAFAEFAGAWINVYTTELSETLALELASSEVAAAGWQVLSVDSNLLRARHDFVDSSDETAYFEQALVDGVVICIHAFVADAGDADALH